MTPNQDNPEKTPDAAEPLSDLELGWRTVEAISGTAMATIKKLRDDVAALVAERDALKAIVGQIPSTSDGVPIVHGTKLCALAMGMVFKCNANLASVDIEGSTVIPVVIDDEKIGRMSSFFKATDCYSTEAAALAAASPATPAATGGEGTK